MMDQSIGQTWQRAKTMAFWDQGEYTHAAWRKEIRTAKPRALVQSVNYMRAADLIELMDRKVFIRTWPALREQAAFHKNKRVILDAAWAVYTVGAINIPVRECIIRFHPKKRSLLRVLAQSNGKQSIYALAKLAGRNPRRVYDDVHDFVAQGLAVFEQGISGGKKTLFPKLLGCHIALVRSSPGQ